ncbi:Na+/H+ antiporter subunit G [Gemmobacter sp.]|uniref:Na+/H+ antiporter subunit G n=1 Tax=Gemmobacter sp. TaxID=1898957 RepID=UPI002AFDD5A8|nr:Na+/H+ antiporter subunit G [Gemmobacter sp.]
MTDTFMLIMEIVVSALIVMAGVFGLVGSWGLIRLPDLMTRLHAPTKATTLGVGGVLIASMIYFAVFMDQFSFHELMITLFLFLTAPISANLLAKAHMLREERPEALPPTGEGCGWATYDETADPSRPTEG